MHKSSDLRHGFVVGILQSLAENREVRELVEIDRLVRREDALLRSGPPIDLTALERQGLNDRNWSMGIVAVDLASRRYIGYTSVHRTVAQCRGTEIEIKEVVTHPEFERRGVGKAVMTVALQEGRGRWGARKATLTSRESRIAARGLYIALGFEQQGEGDQFVLRFGEGYWRPQERARPRFWSGMDREEHGAFWHMEREMQNAVSEICTGTPRSMAPWSIIEPIAAFKFRDAP